MSVEVRDGVVELTGSVDTEAEAEAAVLVTRRVSGVRSVNSSLQLNPPR